MKESLLLKKKKEPKDLWNQVIIECRKLAKI